MKVEPSKECIDMTLFRTVVGMRRNGGGSEACPEIVMIGIIKCVKREAKRVSLRKIMMPIY